VFPERVYFLAGFAGAGAGFGAGAGAGAGAGGGGVTAGCGVTTGLGASFFSQPTITTDAANSNESMTIESFFMRVTSFHRASNHNPAQDAAPV